MKKIFVLIVLASLWFSTYSQYYTFTISNFHLVSGTNNQLEFDIHIRNISTDTLRLQTAMFGINFNYAGLSNGGTITGSFVPGSSYDPSTNAELPPPQNAPIWNVNSTTHRIRGLATIQTNYSLMPIIPTSSPGLKLGTFRLTNTVPYPTNCLIPNFNYNFLSAPNQTKCALHACINSSLTAVNLITQTSFNLYNQGPEYFVDPNSFGNGNLNVNVSSTVTDASCLYSFDGSIDLQVSPASIYSYSWEDGSTQEDLFNCSQGNHIVTISDLSGDCISYQSTVNNTGTNCYGNAGKAFLDANNNCLFDTSDYPIPNMMIHLSNGFQTLTNANGMYSFSQITGGTYSAWPTSSYSIQPTLSCTPLDSITFSSTSYSTENNFLFDFSSAVNNTVNHFSSWVLVPGFSNHYCVFAKSNSFVTTTNTISFVVPIALNYSNAIPSPSAVYNTPNGDSIVWNTSLNPFQQKAFYVFFQIPSTIAIGTSLPSCSYINVLGATDVNLSDNQKCINTIIVGSFDPNDKSVIPAGLGSNGYITPSDSVLEYRINFQNCGTYQAFNINIEDTISSKLDISSLEIIAASHAYQVQLINNELVKFTFPNIMLPDSNSNEPMSHGFIVYRIKQKPGNMFGDEIKNTAYIYFDFNSAVVTNTTLNTLFNGSPTLVESNDVSKVEVEPNPSNGVIRLQVALKEESLFYLTDLTGRIVFETPLKKGSYTQTLVLPASLTSGMYLYAIKSTHSLKQGGKLELVR